MSGTSPVHHDTTRSPTFCVFSTFSNRFFPGFNQVFSGFFPGFNRVFSGFLKNLEKTWFNFHRPPPWPTPFGGPRLFSQGKETENGTDNEKLRPQKKTTDSSAVVFLVWKGPLGFSLGCFFVAEICEIYRVFGWNMNRKPRIGTKKGIFRQNFS